MPGDNNRCLDCRKPIGQGAKRCHSCAAKVRWAQGDMDGISDKIKAAHARGCFDGTRTPESRAKQSKSMKEAWARGDMNGVHTPESNAKISLARKAMWEQGVYDTPEFRNKVSSNTKAAWKRGAFANRDSSEYREKISKGVKETCTPKRRVEMSEKTKEAWARGAYDEMFTPEYRAKLSQSMKEAWVRGDWDGVFISPTKPERIIKKFLEEQGVKHEFQFRLGGFYYDFHIPKRNLLIEYDGVYWHSLPEARERDKEKTELALENNYMLVRLQSQSESETSIRFLIEKGLPR